MIPPLDPASGMLPLGRHPTTIPEVEAAFVTAPAYAASVRRAKVWADFLNLTGSVRAVVPVMAVWMAGSFTSNKLDPDDVDAQFWIRGDDADAHPGDPLLAVVGSGQTRQRLSIDVDAYLGLWRSVPVPALAPSNPLQLGYYHSRGHWDDWWQRTRSQGKGASAVPADAVPRRGYLEVMIDGYRP